MEALQELQAGITATCPLPFQGGNGQLFAQAVAAVVAAHCTFFDDYKWPRDNAEEILQNGPHEFDFIVVGAGTAGSAIAGRLAELNSLWTVLLIEAGDDPGLNSEIPAFLMYNQDIDWKYQTKEDSRSCRTFNGNRCTWNKGKAMGGSSAINAMLYVRGHPRDYDRWENSGNPGWGYEDLKPYFEAIEGKFNLNSYKYHENPWYNILDKAYEELGFPKPKTDKNECQIGTRVTKLTTRNGKRLNSAKLYLKETDNFYVMKNTVVEKVIIDENTLTAKGVLLKHKNHDVMEIFTRKEVILSTGSIATPQLLMLSGIGPRSHLNEKGIDCLVDLPVGQNLQDHTLVPLIFKTNLHNEITPSQFILSVLQYMLEKTGPLSNIGLADYMSFVNTKNVSDYPNIQYFHAYFTKNDVFVLKSYFEGFGYNKEYVDSILEINKHHDIFTIYPTLLHPKSRGVIKLSDSNSQSSPDILTNYYEEAEDIKTLLEGVMFAKKLEQTETFKSMGIELVPLELLNCKEILLDSDEYWNCYIRNAGSTVYHPVGTAKMGPKYDATAVVNNDLKIHGIKNLRVVDASIMPIIPGGNTMSATLIIAEKAFDIIKKHYNEKDEL